MMNFRFAALLLIGFGTSFPSLAAERFITLASTTSTQNSGLFGVVLPKVTKKTGIDVRVVAVGTGAAIRLAQSGDADVLLVHHKTSEEKFVADGHGRYRVEVMYNDFVLIGPKSDPARIKASSSISDALTRIMNTKPIFVSRGDDSGTHKRELELWRRAELDPKLYSGQWYREIGAGMGAALNMAAAQNAYVLTDRSTWLNFANRQDLALLYEGGDSLRNVYGVSPVAKARHPHVKQEMAEIFANWLRSGEGQKAIADYKIKGEQLFFPLSISD